MRRIPNNRERKRKEKGDMLHLDHVWKSASMTSIYLAKVKSNVLERMITIPKLYISISGMRYKEKDQTKQNIRYVLSCLMSKMIISV